VPESTVPKCLLPLKRFQAASETQLWPVRLNVAQAGVPIEVISHRLGRSHIGITVDRYLTVYQERNAAAATALERIVA
jgi:hypothetical protein